MHYEVLFIIHRHCKVSNRSKLTTNMQLTRINSWFLINIKVLSKAIPTAMRKNDLLYLTKVKPVTLNSLIV